MSKQIASKTQLFLYLLLFYMFFRIIFYYAKKYAVCESMTSNSDITVILLGDSMLNNSLYVPQNKSVADRLQPFLMNDLHNFAQDGATISDVYGQIDKLDSKLDRSNTFIFLSAGGNNIINDFNNNTLSNDVNKSDLQISKLFNNYTDLVKTIHNKMPNSQLTLLNLYFPTSSSYKDAKPFIEKWNNNIEDTFAYSLLGKKKESPSVNIIHVNKLLTMDEDFVYHVEPSVIGGKKIADSILNHCDLL
jgi:hypothetical protein